MSYHLEHGIEEERTKKSYINPDISDFIPTPGTLNPPQEHLQEALMLFEALRHQNEARENAVLDNLITQLLQESQQSHKSIPTSKQVIENLKSVSPPPASNCNICLDEFKQPDTVVQLDCKHLFHQDCVVPWLKLNHTCPVCRYELRTDDEEYERQKQKEREMKVKDEDSEEEWDPFYG